jgi:hypothetical protein
MSGPVAESGRSPPHFLGMSIRIGGLYRLAKPFKPKDLLDLIAEILAAPQHATDMQVRVARGALEFTDHRANPGTWHRRQLSRIPKIFAGTCELFHARPCPLLL